MDERKRYSRDELDAAVRLADRIGVKEASTQTGVGYQSIYRHRRRMESRTALERINDRVTELESENAELREKLTRLREYADQVTAKATKLRARYLDRVKNSHGD